MASAARTPAAPGIGILGWIAALLGPVAVSGIVIGFRGDLFPTNAALVLVLPVLAAAILGGRLGGAGAAGVPTLGFDFFFPPPDYSFPLHPPPHAGPPAVI